MKTVHIINKFGPQDNAITGRSAAKLADVLTAKGIQVVFFCLEDSYKTLGARQEQKKINFEIVYLKQRCLGKKGPGRFFTALLDGFRLYRKSTQRPADFTIVMTDPPLLYLWAGMHRRKDNRKIIYWTMDLYPDAFLASGLVSSKNKFHLFLHQRLYNHIPFGIISLGNEQAKYLRDKFEADYKVAILPCGIEDIKPNDVVPEWITNSESGKIKFCYIGNLGEAHDEHFLIDFIQALDPEKHVIYLNVYGAKANLIMETVSKLAAVRKASYLSYHQMHQIDIHIASLKPEWDHVCVPSKAVSAISAGAVLLLNTSTDCDNWKMFEPACFNIQPTTTGYQTQIIQFLESLTFDKINTKRSNASQLAKQLLATQADAYQTILNWVNTK